MSHAIRALALLGALAAAPACLTGCVLGSSSRVETSGTPISSGTLCSLEAGVTSEEQALALLGAPTRTTTTDDGTTTHVYEFRKTRHSRGYLLFVFSGRSTEVDHRVAYVQVKDGVVQKWWFDEA